MLKIAFVSCAHLSRFFPSTKNALLTHDDQLAADYLSNKGCEVKAIIWGMDINELRTEKFDIIILRSTWDYMDSENNRQSFINWLHNVSALGLPLVNNFSHISWNFDKHYLAELAQNNVAIPPTIFLDSEDCFEQIKYAHNKWSKIVIKPCISAAAKDTYLLGTKEEIELFFPRFMLLKKGRSFMVQPFISAVQTCGEWSCIVIDGRYSHAVLKKPQTGHWLVQDEQGGSVQCLDAPHKIIEFATDAYSCLKKILKEKYPDAADLLFCRIDILPGPMIGEIELIEPELFFLDRRLNKGRLDALESFYEGIKNFTKKY